MQQCVKRVMDVVVASGLLLVLGLPTMLVAWVIRRDGSPALFNHTRIGKNAVEFNCLKFRSMVPDSEKILEQYLASNPEARAEWQADHKLKNDPRITRFGELLRKYSIDELPQLINVIKGDMSMVGPRPIVAAEVVKYGDAIADYYRVRPGISGLWQVSGRNDLTYDERVQLDSRYVNTWSLWRDIVIMLKTLPVLLNRSGAY